MDNLEKIKALKRVVDDAFSTMVKEIVDSGGGMSRVHQTSTRWGELQGYLIHIQLLQEAEDRKEEGK